MPRAQFLDNKQGMAMQTAVSRGQFEINCPAATGTGCGRRITFVVICPDEGDGCFATGPGRFVRE